MNIGQFVAAEIIVILIINSVEKMIFTIESIYDVLTSVEKIAAVTDLPLEDVINNTKDFNQQEAMSLKLKKVTLTDKMTDYVYLNNLELDVKGGEKIGIAGDTNTGKAILLQFVSGWYNDYEGNILYNGIPANDLNLTDIRREIGDCMSTGNLFQGTIEENIMIGSPLCSFSEVQKAAEITGLSEFIESSNKGYQIMIYPGDNTFPKKIQQQIKWTRGILGNKSLILWEDVFGTTSREEKLKFTDYLCDKSINRTVLMVSNDMKILQKCDRVLGMEGGEIIYDIPSSEIKENEWFKKTCMNSNA
jgi:ABC-type bacteriocin/lantibiotic exporter with double-glycine peptidase domain